MPSYDIEIEAELEKSIKKLQKRDKALYTVLFKKILQLSEKPHIGKPLRSVLKGKWRVHVGHFVLTYKIDESQKRIVLLDFSHHDEAYK